MPRALSFALFLAIALTILGAAHYYVWARLVRDLALPARTHRIATAAVIVLYLSLPLAFMAVRPLGPSSGKLLALFAFGWLGMLLLIVTLLLAGELPRLMSGVASYLSQSSAPQDPTRRTALARLLGGTVAVLSVGLGAVALRSGLARVAVKRVEVALERLPGALDGTTIVQLTDLHIGPTINRDFVEEIVETVNRLRPDVVAITGDLVDGSVETLGPHVAPLGHIETRHGVYFVTGNHEYYSGCDEWCSELERLGIKVLRNERVTIGTDGASFDLAGIDDYQATRVPGETGPDLEKALQGRNPARELVLLAHQPKAIHQAEQLGVGLQLSGHTHGGQLWPWKYLVGLTQPVVSGLEKIGKAFVYVSNGTGYWGPPMRLGAPAEVTQVVLRKARA